MKASVIALVAGLILAGCGSSPAPQETPQKTKAAAPAEAKAETETGRIAFQKLLLAAHNWAPDAQPLHLQSRARNDDPRDGTAAIWDASFASASKRSMRSFTWAGVKAEDTETGINPGSIGDYSPSNASTQPFPYAFLRTDSNQALETANKHGGKAILAKDKQLPLKFDLVWEPGQSRLVWKVIYGTSENSAKLTVLVNASNNQYIRAEK